MNHFQNCGAIEQGNIDDDTAVKYDNTDEEVDDDGVVNVM